MTKRIHFKWIFIFIFTKFTQKCFWLHFDIFQCTLHFHNDSFAIVQHGTNSKILAFNCVNLFLFEVESLTWYKLKDFSIRLYKLLFIWNWKCCKYFILKKIHFNNNCIRLPKKYSTVPLNIFFFRILSHLIYIWSRYTGYINADAINLYMMLDMLVLDWPL
jgi:hypothetical protein